MSVQGYRAQCETVAWAEVEPLGDDLDTEKVGGFRRFEDPEVRRGRDRSAFPDTRDRDGAVEVSGAAINGEIPYLVDSAKIRVVDVPDELHTLYDEAVFVECRGSEAKDLSAQEGEVPRENRHVGKLAGCALSNDGNGYRFAGETDSLEGLLHAGNRYGIGVHARTAPGLELPVNGNRSCLRIGNDPNELNIGQRPAAGSQPLGGQLSSLPWVQDQRPGKYLDAIEYGAGVTRVGHDQHRGGYLPPDSCGLWTCAGGY